MPLQQKEISKAAPPAFLVFYSFAPTDDPVVMSSPFLSPPAFEIQSEAQHDVLLRMNSTSTNPPIPHLPLPTIAAPGLRIPTAIVPNHPVPSLCVPPSNCSTTSSQPVPESSSSSSSSSRSAISALASARLSGLINATPQLIRFGVLPHRPDIREWGVHSTAA